eukprot:gene10563-7334_t
MIHFNYIYYYYCYSYYCYFQQLLLHFTLFLVVCAVVPTVPYLGGGAFVVVLVLFELPHYPAADVHRFTTICVYIHSVQYMLYISVVWNMGLKKFFSALEGSQPYISYALCMHNAYPNALYTHSYTNTIYSHERLTYALSNKKNNNNNSGPQALRRTDATCIEQSLGFSCRSLHTGPRPPLQHQIYLFIYLSPTASTEFRAITSEKRINQINKQTIDIDPTYILIKMLWNTAHVSSALYFPRYNWRVEEQAGAETLAEILYPSLHTRKPDNYHLFKATGLPIILLWSIILNPIFHSLSPLPSHTQNNNNNKNNNTKQGIFLYFESFFLCHSCVRRIRPPYEAQHRIVCLAAQQPRDEKERKVGIIKDKLPLDEICAGCPRCFVLLLNYARKMMFEETPAYDMIRALLRRELSCMTEEEDYIFDWDMSPEKEPVLSPVRHPSAKNGGGLYRYGPDGAVLQSDADAKGILSGPQSQDITSLGSLPLSPTGG